MRSGCKPNGRRDRIQFAVEIRSDIRIYIKAKYLGGIRIIIEGMTCIMISPRRDIYSQGKKGLRQPLNSRIDEVAKISPMLKI